MVIRGVAGSLVQASARRSSATAPAASPASAPRSRLAPASHQSESPSASNPASGATPSSQRDAPPCERTPAGRTERVTPPKPPAALGRPSGLKPSSAALDNRADTVSDGACTRGGVGSNATQPTPE